MSMASFETTDAGVAKGVAADFRYPFLSWSLNNSAQQPFYKTGILRKQDFR